MTWLVTSLLDGERYPAEMIRQLYRNRWPVETAIGEVKHPLSADVLRSKTVDGAYKEMTAKVMAFNLIRCVMLKAARQCASRPDRLSFSNARRLVVAYSLRMSAAPIWRLQALYDEMLYAIARVAVPYRPGRIEPRAVRRERKHYERLKTSRRTWRLKHASVA